MLVLVGKICQEGGVPLPRHREVTQEPRHFGELCYSEQYEKDFRRSVYTAYLRSPEGGADVLPPLRDAVLRFAAGGVMTFSGIEVDEETRARVAQSWYVKLVEDSRQLT